MTDTTLVLHRFLSSATISLYRYSNLKENEIRLIDLFPGSFDDPLRCKLRSVSLLEKLQYESLSYCWGRNKPEAELDCKDGSIPVTKNLAVALQHLRHANQQRTLWIDAVCINQQNLHERGQQVVLMKKIIQYSHRTLVWLGEETLDSQRAIKLIRHLAEAWQQRETESFWWSNSLIKVPRLYDPAWRAFAILCQRPWFRRAWIVQEASVAKDIMIMCGTESIAWEELICAVHFETRSNFQNGDLPPLRQVLLRNRSFFATDPRDKVYGVLSLANQDDLKAMEVQPDYHLPVNQLYKNITMSLLEQHGLSALSASGVVGKNERQVPSWVADWSVSDPSVPLDWVESEYGDRTSYTPLPPTDFRAWGSTTSTPLFNHQKNMLGLDGILIGQVEVVGTLARTRYLHHVSHMFQLFVHCYDSMHQLKNWEEVARVRSRERYVTGERNRDAYWYTLCAGRVPGNIKSDPRIKHHILIRSLRSIVRFSVGWFPRTEQDTWYNRLFYTMFQALLRIFDLTPAAKIQRIGFPPESRLSNYRRMVRTKNGYIALVPKATRAGDWIGVFKGGKMPLVIRRDGEQWILIGESYVHGLMIGEAWNEEKCELMWFK